MAVSYNTAYNPQCNGKDLKNCHSVLEVQGPQKLTVGISPPRCAALYTLPASSGNQRNILFAPNERLLIHNHRAITGTPGCLLNPKRVFI